MSTIDVRNISSSTVHEIRFADAESRGGSYQASVISQGTCNDIEIYEGDNGDYIRVLSIEHAQDLIKALEKAIELEWLK